MHLKINLCLFFLISIGSARAFPHHHIKEAYGANGHPRPIETNPLSGHYDDSYRDDDLDEIKGDTRSDDHKPTHVDDGRHDHVVHKTDDLHYHEPHHVDDHSDDDDKVRKTDHHTRTDDLHHRHSDKGDYKRDDKREPPVFYNEQQSPDGQYDERVDDHARTDDLHHHEPHHVDGHSKYEDDKVGKTDHHARTDDLHYHELHHVDDHSDDDDDEVRKTDHHARTDDLHHRHSDKGDYKRDDKREPHVFYNGQQSPDGQYDERVDAPNPEIRDAEPGYDDPNIPSPFIEDQINPNPDIRDAGEPYDDDPNEAAYDEDKKYQSEVRHAGAGYDDQSYASSEIQQAGYADSETRADDPGYDEYGKDDGRDDKAYIVDDYNYDRSQVISDRPAVW